MSTAQVSPVRPEVEVLAKARRRRFTAEKKAAILREADACTQPGEVAALLRREGLYSSHLTAWRAARKRGGLAGSAERKRGPKAQPPDARDKRIVALERETRKLAARAERAEALVDLQKKVAALLGRPIPEEDES